MPEGSEWLFYIGAGLILLIVLSKTGIINTTSTSSNQSINNAVNSVTALPNETIEQLKARVCDPQIVDSFDVVFCHHGTCADRTVQAIDESTASIYIVTNTLTDNNIFDALVRAHRRGVDIRFLMDIETASDPVVFDERIEDANIQIRYGQNVYSNYMISDKIKVYASTGYLDTEYSKNINTLNIIKSNNIAQKYINNFFILWDAALMRTPTV